VTQVRVGPVADFAGLAARWRDLEGRAGGSVFQSWTWTGTLLAERFTDPVLVEATEAGRTVALALFNRVRGGLGQPDLLYLGESGDPARDCPYIEHNGVLTEPGREAELAEACLGAVARSHVLIMSGVGETMLAAATRVAGAVWVSKASDGPFADLAAVRARGGDYLSGLSANAREQIRRSDRFYAAQGDVTVREAGSVAEAHAMLARMEVLHQATWTARGRPGSFATPFFGRFHCALIEAGFPLGQIALIEVASGGRTIGILYNLRDAGGVRAYQSGFAYERATPRAKPGLTCHHAAIRLALAEGAGRYDFLAGDDRYKRSMASDAARQYWLEAGPAWAPRMLRHRLRQTLGGGG
jgi:CelD/BcsL family acetyltransferase involved in cellulose biosynthesis